MKQASIDLGTNTCLLLIQEGARVIHDESNIVRLGQGVDQTRLLAADAMQRTRECLTKYAQILKSNGVEPSSVVAVGTASARDAQNSTEFFSSLQKDLGFQFRTLSGDQEAKATFLGAAVPSMDPHRMVVMDIGGGSTELVSINGGKSLNIGAVRLTERHLKSNPVADDEFWKCEDAIDTALEEMMGWRKTLPSDVEFVAVAGSAVTLAMLQLGASEFNQKQIDGFNISRGDAHRIVEELKWRNVDERKRMPGMEVKRADVILAGALIFWRVMEKMDWLNATISTRGLRYGVLNPLFK